VIPERELKEVIAELSVVYMVYISYFILRNLTVYFSDYPVQNFFF